MDIQFKIVTTQALSILVQFVYFLSVNKMGAEVLYAIRTDQKHGNAFKSTTWDFY